MAGLKKKIGDKAKGLIESNQPPPVMPLPDDEAAQDAKKRSVSGQRRRRGRMSTVFSEGEGLGG